MRFWLPLVALVATGTSFAQTYPPESWQINTAVLAAPEHARESATVLGYKSDGALVVLRKGSNDLICLADDPARKGFKVASYHKSLEPFMERGRELRRDGKSAEEIFQIRGGEVKSGMLDMPEQALLYVLTGQVNKESMKVEKMYLRYIFYIPFATAESTGLPLAPTSPGGPWIMDPGTHRAHIMITPPKNE